jgi:outer membrane protein insertion porin family
MMKKKLKMKKKEMMGILKRLSLYLVSLSLLFAFQNSLISQGGASGEGQTYNIAGISCEGNEFVASETIISLSGLVAGTTFVYPFDDKITNAVKRLWDRKQFTSVDIVVDRIGVAGVFLVIKVKENTRLSEIIIKNNDDVSTNDIKEAVNRYRGDIISGYDVYLAKREILTLYKEEDLAFAEIDIEMEPTDTAQYSRMEIFVEEGAAFDVDEIIFDGVENLDISALNSAMENVGGKAWWEFWSSSDYNQDDYEGDLEKLKMEFKRQGFIDAELLSDTVIYNEEDEEVRIELKIYEGEKVYFRKAYFEGNTVFTQASLLKRLEFGEGEVYDQERFDMNLNMNQEQSDAKSLYNNTGYLFCEFVKEEKRIAEDTVDVYIKVFEGDRAMVRRVNILGNIKTKDKVIRRELYVRPGDYFNRSAIIRSVNALNVLGYFNPEALRPDVKPIAQDKTAVDIEIRVEEQSTDTFNAQIGFAGSFGLTGALGFTFNNFALDEPFSGGGGELLNFNWEFGQASRFSSFSIGYTQPWLLDEPTTIGFNIYDTRINWSYKYNRRGISMNIGRRLKWPDDYFRINYSIRAQENDVESASIYYRQGKSTEITIGQTISRASLNNLFFPTTGSSFSLSTSWAMGSVGIGTTDFIKNELKFDLYNPLMKIGEHDRMVLYLGTLFGYIDGIVTDTTLNPIELYRMGGSNIGGFGITPLRGYDDRSINDIGGKLMMKYTAELRFAISLNPMPVYVYGYAEAGNVWDEMSTLNPFDLKRATGVGLEMFVNPIGILGFSYGYGYDPSILGSGIIEPGWRFNFSMGR